MGRPYAVCGTDVGPTRERRTIYYASWTLFALELPPVVTKHMRVQESGWSMWRRWKRRRGGRWRRRSQRTEASGRRRWTITATLMCEIVGSETAGRPGQHTARGTGRLTDLPTPQPHTYQINYTDREDRLKPHTVRAQHDATALTLDRFVFRHIAIDARPSHPRDIGLRAASLPEGFPNPDFDFEVNNTVPWELVPVGMPLLLLRGALREGRKRGKI
eukprot:800093-Rhodomonas_salina.1